MKELMAARLRRRIVKEAIFIVSSVCARTSRNCLYLQLCPCDVCVCVCVCMCVRDGNGSHMHHCEMLNVHVEVYIQHKAVWPLKE